MASSLKIQTPWPNNSWLIVDIRIIFLSTAAILPGCGEPWAGLSNGPNAHSKGTVVAETSPEPPKPEELRLTSTSDKFHTLDFMALSGCKLQITLGKYQSSLGRGASNSQRLLLDLEYLRLTPPCIDYQRELGRTKFAVFLRRVQTLKKTQLPNTLFNATLANTQFHQFWSNAIASKGHPEQQALTLSAIHTINALVSRWLSGDYRASNIEFEIALSEVAKGYPCSDRECRRGMHRAIAQLERQLYAPTPRQYREWQHKRERYFTRLQPLSELK